YLATEGWKVVVFESTNAVLSATRPLLDFLRKSQCLSILSPHVELRTQQLFECFLHTTKLGNNLIHSFWNLLAEGSVSQTHLIYNSSKLPKDAPLCNTSSVFWGVCLNDEGVVWLNSFNSLVNAGEIQVVTVATSKDNLSADDLLSQLV
ncbi:hypothetical protein K439DRAFT_1351193, partial [Ramaria rubella]